MKGFGLLVALLCLPFTGQALGNVITKSGDGAQVRVLDTITGLVDDIDIGIGDTTVYERLNISVTDCRYPQDSIVADAFAYLVIRDVRETLPVFEGWMIASSPALSALEHPRYDVWVLRCVINQG